MGKQFLPPSTLAATAHKKDPNGFARISLRTAAAKAWQPASETSCMDKAPDNDRLAELLEAVRQLAATNQQVAGSLAKLEVLYTAEVNKQEEPRKVLAEEKKEWKERQKKWDERDKKWEEERAKLPKFSPWQALAVLLGIAVVLLAAVQLLQ